MGITITDTNGKAVMPSIQTKVKRPGGKPCASGCDSNGGLCVCKKLDLFDIKG